MSNLYLTFLCNNRCSYCFLMGKLKHNIADCVPADFLSLEDARIAAEFFRDDSEISFLGGEPTLRMDVLDLADQIFPFLDIFTNGTIRIPSR